MVWYPIHYTVIPLTYLAVLSLAVLSRHLSQKTRMNVLRILWVLMLVSELLKNLIALHKGTHNALYYPFHYSTTYLFTLPVYLFGRGRVRHWGAVQFFVGGLILFFTMLLSPYSVVGNTANFFRSYHSFHSFFYHAAVLLIFCVFVASGDYRPTKWDPLLYLSFVVPWSVVARRAALAFHINYAGLWKPYIPVLRTVQVRWGDTAFLLLYGVGVALVATVSIFAYHFLRRTWRRRKRPVCSKKKAQ